MVRAEIIYLISESPAEHGVFDAPTETKLMRYAEITSVRMSEFYTALSAGIEPQYIFKMADYSDYNDEKLIEWNNKRYRVIRTYVNGQSIEITVGEATNDR